MSDPNDFEDALREGLRDSTARVTADEELQRRLVAGAVVASSLAPRPVRDSYFRSSWAVPLAAAVITALSVGSVILVAHDAHSSGVVSGDGTFKPPASTPAAVPTPTPTPVTSTTAATSKAAPAVSTSAAPTTSQAPTPTHKAATKPAQQSSSSASPTPTPPPVPAACTAAAGGASNPTSLADFKARITRTWRVCSEPSVFGTTDAGLQITADGKWAKLVRDPAGHLVKATGLRDSGTWEALDDSAMNGRPVFQINLMTGNSTYILMADFAAAVERVELDNNGVYVTDYVPTTEAVVGS
jgi:hypothetical protein